MKEPLKHFLEKYGVDIAKIDRLVSGLRYSAVLLKNGNIGVCANLLNEVEVEIKDLKSPDLNNMSQRIILNAYFNALMNYTNKYKNEADIFDVVDFCTYKKIIMIGHFRPLLNKFEQTKIKISVFDLTNLNYQFSSEKSEMKYISEVDAIILTATSVFNRTFMSIINSTRKDCDIFILGPSSLMNEDMLKYKNIKIIFGSVFRSNDERVLNTVRNGGGTRQFIRFGKKVYFNNS